MRIIEQIGVHYFEFGVCLLDDRAGNRVRAIETFRQSHPDMIISDILQEWLKGRGRRPETWSTLLACLHNTRLCALADNLENVLDGVQEDPITQGNAISSPIVTSCYYFSMTSIDYTSPGVVDKEEFHHVISLVELLQQNITEIEQSFINIMQTFGAIANHFTSERLFNFCDVLLE